MGRPSGHRPTEPGTYGVYPPHCGSKVLRLGIQGQETQELRDVSGKRTGVALDLGIAGAFGQEIASGTE